MNNILPMSSSKLRFIVEQTPVIAFVEVLHPDSGFFLCLKRKSNALATILLLSKAICNVCRVPFDESVKCLCESVVAERDFWNRCMKFLTDSTAPAPKKQSKLQNESMTDDEKGEIWQCITALCQSITNHEIVLDKTFLKSAIQLIENNQNNQLILDDHLNDLKKCLEYERPRDSRNLYPSLDELTSDISSSRNSIPFSGIYKDVAQYMAIHLALLREDFLLPIRYAVDQITSNSGPANDPSVYRNVEILMSEKEYVSFSSRNREVKKTVCIVADLELQRRKKIKGPSYYSVADYSKRLQTGSLLFFTTSSKFDNLVIAKVQSHNPRLLERGYIDIVIVKTYNITGIFDQNFTMYERPPYYYREIYEILKNITENTFPMQKNLIDFDTTTDIGYPAYVPPHQPKVIYKYRKHTVDIKAATPWSSAAGTTSFNLNAKQLTALQRSLTQKVCTISTNARENENVLLPSEIVATLYANTDRRILIVCHSGKILTEILADTEMYTDNLTRIANHDFNDQLDQFNLHKIQADHPNEEIFKRINAYRYVLHTGYREEVNKFVKLQMQMKDGQGMQGEYIDEYLRIQRRMESLSKRLQEMKQIVDFECIKSKRIVGITSFAALKFQALIQLLQSPIVIIVGAQNILEAHTISMLTTNLEHLILIGDPKKSKHERVSSAFLLSQVYNIKYSLFERVSHFSIESGGKPSKTGKSNKTAEKAAYRGPSILDTLKSSRRKAAARPVIKGIGRFVFVFDHKNPTSMAIEFESHFALALCSYFLKQGYSPEDITILTVNFQQMQQILADRSARENCDDQYQNLCKVPVQVLTNFKKKNNGIILLSMVSTDADDVGEIARKIEIIFARTKLGLYIIGSMPATKLLQHIRKAIQAENAVGDEMELVCQTHGNVTKIHSAADIDELQFGGCMAVCNQLTACGDVCMKLCHTTAYTHAHAV